jgi:putative SOS response-associated peptidase YedK
MKPVHDRMPVMIGKDEIRPWLSDNEKLSEFLERPQVRLIREQDSGQIRMDFGI